MTVYGYGCYIGYIGQDNIPDFSDEVAQLHVQNHLHPANSKASQTHTTHVWSRSNQPQVSQLAYSARNRRRNLWS